MLRSEEQFEQLAQSLSKARDVLYLGRGINYPIALEGAPTSTRKAMPRASSSTGRSHSSTRTFR
jgi:hypothetical protein